MARGLAINLKLLKTINRLPEFLQDLGGGVNRVIRSTCIAIDNRVKTTAPFKTGNLRRSYHFQLFPEKLAGQVGSDPRIAPYAPHLEFGTSKQKAQPHLGPAGEAERVPFERALQKVIDETTRRWSAGSGK